MHSFRKKKKLNENKSVFWCSLQLLDEVLSILKEYSQILSQIWTGFHVKAPVILVKFSSDLVRFSKNPNFMKIRWVGAELLHTDRRTDERRDMTKLIVFIFVIFWLRLKRLKVESIWNTPSQVLCLSRYKKSGLS